MSEFEGRIIHSKAPVRFDFGGGPTDVDPFKSREGGYVLNAGIKQHARVTITERPDARIVIRSSDYNIEESYDSINDVAFDGPLRLIKAALKYISPTQGLEINTKVDVPPGSGLGASASIAIALVGALRSQIGEEQLNPRVLIEDALYIENVMLQNINGGQDQYAAALGGFHSFDFSADSITVKPLNVKPDTIKELEARSLLCYSGESHLSGTVLEQIMKQYVDGNLTTINALRAMKNLTHDVEIALLDGNLEAFGNTMKAIEESQRRFHPAVYPSFVNDLFDIARRNGAIGGKLAGAGGGGCVYFYCEEGKKNNVANVLQRNHVPLVPTKFVKDGVTVW